MNDNRRIRVFVSSTFRDMMGERDELMTLAGPNCAASAASGKRNWSNAA